jgi:hypothetical protein
MTNGGFLSFVANFAAAPVCGEEGGQRVALFGRRKALVSSLDDPLFFLDRLGGCPSMRGVLPTPPSCPA